MYVLIFVISIARYENLQNYNAPNERQCQIKQQYEKGFCRLLTW